MPPWLRGANSQPEVSTGWGTQARSRPSDSTDHHPGDDDHELQRDGVVVLFSDGFGQVLKDHGIGPSPSRHSQREGFLPVGFAIHPVMSGRTRSKFTSTVSGA